MYIRRENRYVHRSFGEDCITATGNHRLNLCKTFDEIDILNSHKRLERGGTESGESTKPQSPAGVG
jgi:hypothetical protein